MRIPMFSVLAAAVLAAGASAAPAVDPVAMITDLQGKVEAGAGGAAPAILASVNPGATLSVADGGALVVVYFGSGKEFAFKGPASVRFGATAPEMLTGAAPTTRDPLMGKVAGAGKIKPVGKIQAAVVMRGANEKAKIKFDSLAGTRVLESRPEFRWQGPGEGLNYSFELSDEAGAVMFEQTVGGTSFKLPESVQLQPGAKYTARPSPPLPTSPSPRPTCAPTSKRCGRRRTRRCPNASPTRPGSTSCSSTTRRASTGRSSRRPVAATRT
jgi:hypothetical protein